MGMAKNDRLLYILNLLRSRKSLNAARLAEECNVTERSIYRDIISLSEANIPIYYDNGYKLASDNFLPPLNFSFEEFAAIKLALESSPLGKSGAGAGILRRVQAKIEAGLSSNTREKKKTARDTAHIEIDAARVGKKGERFYATIEEAINSLSCLDIDYVSINHGLTHRTVEPYFIIFRGRAFYFVAFCRMRNEFRTFRIDRVQKIMTTETHFRRQKGINPKTYFEDSWRLYSGKPVEVLVKFVGNSAKVVRSGQHHPKEVIVEKSGGCLLYQVTVNGIDEIQRWILGFGDEAEVIAPQELIDNLSAVGRYFVDIYKNNRKS